MTTEENKPTEPEVEVTEEASGVEEQEQPEKESPEAEEAEEAAQAEEAEAEDAGPEGGEPEEASEAEAAEEAAQAAPAPKAKRPLGLYIALGIAAAIIIALCAVLAVTFLGDQGSSRRDPNAALGQLEGKSEEEIQAELDRIVEEGMFNVSISSVVEFEDGTAEGNLCIENVPGNLYLMQVDITRDDTGDLLYQTGLIDPNHHIQSDSLEVDLDAGEYECTATFNAHDAETEELIGQAAVKMTIKVLG